MKEIRKINEPIRPLAEDFEQGDEKMRQARSKWPRRSFDKNERECVTAILGLS